MVLVKQPLDLRIQVIESIHYLHEVRPASFATPPVRKDCGPLQPRWAPRRSKPLACVVFPFLDELKGRVHVDPLHRAGRGGGAGPFLARAVVWPYGGWGPGTISEELKLMVEEFNKLDESRII